MKVYLAPDILQSLIFGEKNIKKQIEKSLTEKSKKNSRFFTSSIALAEVISFTEKHETRQEIYSHCLNLFDSVLEPGKSEIALAISLSRESGLAIPESIEVATAIISGSELILTAEEKYEKQNSVEVEIIK